MKDKIPAGKQGTSYCTFHSTLQDSSDFGDSAYHTWNTALIDFSNDLIGCQFQVGSRAIEGSTADSDYGTRDPTNWIICVGRTHGAGGIHAR